MASAGSICWLCALAFMSGPSPDIAGQVGSGAIVAGIEKDLFRRATFYQFAHP
jgi:hypothetical protein